MTVFILEGALFSKWKIFSLQVAMPILCMLVRTNPGDKNPEISLVLATISSFLVFFAPHATTVAVRHSLDLGGVELTPYETWILQVNDLEIKWLVTPCS